MNRIAIITRCMDCHHSAGDGYCDHDSFDKGKAVDLSATPPDWCPLMTTGNEHYAAILCRTLVAEWQRTGTREVPSDIQERLMAMYGPLVQIEVPK